MTQRYRDKFLQIRLPSEAHVALSTAAARHGLSITDFVLFGTTLAEKTLDEQAKETEQNKPNN